MRTTFLFLIISVDFFFFVFYYTDSSLYFIVDRLKQNNIKEKINIVCIFPAVRDPPLRAPLVDKGVFQNLAL